ncbi:MAG: hypothetical protein IPH57_04275 [Saprospiraceae bacterium]|nr:hypothetical protein [Saprospiraceae bacterium]
MKTLKLFVIAFAAISINACTQKPNVPENVNKAFIQKFPDAKSLKWDKENETGGSRVQTQWPRVFGKLFNRWRLERNRARN